MSLEIYLNDNTCAHCGRGDEVYAANITHNLGEMAAVAGIYGVLWRPDETGIQNAGQMIIHLERAIDEMEANPKKFKKYNARNGWGLYENFVPWLKTLLNACRMHPEASVRVSR